MERHICVIFIVLSVGALNVLADVNCTQLGAGRHPDPDDDSCRNYTLCIFVQATDSYLSYHTVCPNPTVFNPKISKCTSSSNYECKVNRTSTRSRSVCTSDGLFADLKPTNCSTYIQCVEIDGVYVETQYTCPENTYFNPNSSLCEADYVCTTTVFKCSSPGRFPDKFDLSCQRYHFCVMMQNGTFVQYDYICPGVSMFNPATQLCSTHYTCT